jgi:hypothetical protein
MRDDDIPVSRFLYTPPCTVIVQYVPTFKCKRATVQGSMYRYELNISEYKYMQKVLGTWYIRYVGTYMYVL